MKHFIKHLPILLMALVASATFVSCGSDDEPSSSLTWDQIEGYYLAKPVSNGSKWEWWDAEGLIINSYTLTVCQCSNAGAFTGNTFPGFNSVKKSFAKAYWTYSSTSNTYHGLILKGDKAQLVDDNRYVELSSNGVRFNGQEYYNATYFNSHIASWMGE